MRFLQLIYCLLCFVAFCGTHVLASDASKQAVPTGQELVSARSMMQEIYKQDLAAAKTPELKAKLAGKLQHAADDASMTGPSRYVLLEQARSLAGEAGRLDQTLQLTEDLAAGYELSAPALKLDSLAAVLKATKESGHHRRIAVLSLKLVEQAVLAGDDSTARSALTLATSAARLSKDPDLVRSTGVWTSDLPRLLKLQDDHQKAQVALKVNAQDPQANLAAGLYLALVQGQWEQGVARLKLAGEVSTGPWSELMAIVKAEGDTAPLPSQAKVLGDRYWTLAEKERGWISQQMRERAAQWYTLASTGLKGLEKTLVDKRLAEIEHPVTKNQGTRVGGGESGTRVLDHDDNTVSLVLPKGVKLKMVRIPAGQIHKDSDTRLSDRKVQKPFYMGIHEVTQAQWIAVMGTTPWKDDALYLQQRQDNPAMGISWEEASEFCKVLSRKTNKKFRLPRSVEWEYACRAGASTTYSFGNGDSNLGEYAWYQKNAWWDNRGVRPVGQKTPNVWGLYDMLGNVWEWCQDPDDTGKMRMIRGGAINSESKYSRPAFYNFNPPGHGSPLNGFRIVMEDSE